MRVFFFIVQPFIILVLMVVLHGHIRDVSWQGEFCDPGIFCDPNVVVVYDLDIEFCDWIQTK